MVGDRCRGAIMTDERFQQIELLIADAGRHFDPVTGIFDALEGDDDEDIASDLSPADFLGLLGITQAECAEYVQRKAHDYDESFRNT